MGAPSRETTSLVNAGSVRAEASSCREGRDTCPASRQLHIGSNGALDLGPLWWSPGTARLLLSGQADSMATQLLALLGLPAQVPEKARGFERTWLTVSLSPSLCSPGAAGDSRPAGPRGAGGWGEVEARLGP